MKPGSRAIIVRTAFAASVVFSSLAHAAGSLTIVPQPPYTDTLKAKDGSLISCTDAQTRTQSYSPCTVTAFIDKNLATPTATFLSPKTFNGTPPDKQNFQTTFDLWNKAKGATFGGNWKLIVTNQTLDIKITVTQFKAAADAVVPVAGGTSIQAELSNYNPGKGDPTIDQLAWSQALYTNFLPPNKYSTDRKIYNTLDTWTSSGFTANSCTMPPAPGKNNTTPFDYPNNNKPPSPTNPQPQYCDPVYPNQGLNRNGTDKGFGDFPKGNWGAPPPASFRGIALLSTVTFKTDGDGNVTERDLTVYNNGIDWGFDLAIPEPAYLMVLALLAPFLALKRKRRLPRAPAD